ncbi:molybdopterin-dependent oxidoreductase [Pseudokineococcus lusitanus]|uniref:DMSO/TMAO reductase YedYZ molybdopterin-dependent catalytic subunit n=1 Tax=Pseudokineococcus lusitanus TaxID=763993 RepID=A0A3N1HTX1_9ACTN|nr:molybdopterin-dependent oxidoreductase [Pseudokineococcus lusitanus]ROP45984.1 DMSO/TMAO reductase YedYZ molybdopterin-dependent catalytic subunit [Pseudokineococcus lusitanus]
MSTVAPRTTRPEAAPGRRRGPGAGLLAALAGLASAALTLGVAEVVAGLVAPTAAPVLAVGAAFVDVTPAWLKEGAISLFGTNDKVALFVGIGLVLGALAAAAGLLARRRQVLGDLVVLVLGAAGVAAALSRPDAAPLSVLPSAAGALAGVLALRALVARLGRVEEAGRRGQDPDGAGRRAFLAAVGATGAIAGVAFAGGRALGVASRGVAAARSALRLPAPAVAAAPVPAGVDVGVEGVGPWSTPVADFYRIDTALSVPQVDPATWTLRIHGMVEEEVEITYDELVGGELGDLVEQWTTLTCVSNEVGGRLAGNARWLGLPLHLLLERARPVDGADMVLSTSSDGWTASTPLGALTDAGVGALLAFGMDGQPLPTEHGFPVRMVVPGLYGFVSATKWVVDLEVTRYADRTAYWTDRGWSETGVIKTASRIEVPTPLSRAAVGAAVAGGTAWAQGRGVAKVEVRVDDGDWAEAELGERYDDDTWVQWRFPYELTEGRHTLTVRATDGDGVVQTEERADPIPDGASGWHSITVTGTT